MLKQDKMTQDILCRILEEGCKDINPRPHWADGTPAHTLSINHVIQSYDLSKGEIPLITLRPIAIKSSIGELLWIYQDQSNDLNLLKNKYNIDWWDEWDLGDRTIGQCYGKTVKDHDLMNKLLEGLKKDPDGRRHIINLWQEDDFKKPHGLKPCAYQTQFNVRHGDKDYLDMCLYQRSSDYVTAGCINQMQYTVFLMLVAHVMGYTPGRFTWFVGNIQIYDRHVEAATELLSRESIQCTPTIWINPDVKDFYDFTLDDIKVEGYPRDIIKEKNKQIKLPIAI